MSRQVGQLDIMSMETLLFGNKNNNLSSSDSANRGLNALQKRAQQLKKWQEHEEHLKKIENWSDPAAKKQRTTRVRFSNPTLFQAACANGDIDECSSLLAAGTDINCVNVDGMTGMHQACIDDNVDMVRFLIQHAADVNAVDNDGWTPLHAAANCGHLEIVQLLLDNNADPRIVNNDGELACDIAETEEVEELIRKRLIQLQSDPNVDFEESVRRLRSAEMSLMERDVNQMIQNGKYDDKIHERTAATLLHVAASKGYASVLDKLLSCPKLRPQINIDCLDHEKWTPLAAACYFQQIPCVELLLKHGADPNFKTPSGQSLEDITESKEVVQLIEKHRDRLKREAEEKKQELKGPVVATTVISPVVTTISTTGIGTTSNTTVPVLVSVLSNGSRKKEKAPATPVVKNAVTTVTSLPPASPSSSSSLVPLTTVAVAPVVTPVVTTSAIGSPAPPIAITATGSTIPVTASTTTTTTITSAAAASTVATPPSESETQRKAHAKRVREARRSTQGISADDVSKAKEQIQKQHVEQQNQQQQQQQQQQQKRPPVAGSPPESPASSTPYSTPIARIRDPGLLTSASTTPSSTSQTATSTTTTSAISTTTPASSNVDSNDYKKLKKMYEEAMAQLESLKKDFALKEQELYREKRQLQRKVSELEEENKMMDLLRSDNQRLKDENGALIRVISKLSK